MALNKRQNKILEFINNKQSAMRFEIEEFINQAYDNVSKVTIIRDLDLLYKNKLIDKTGKARSVTYLSLIKNEILRPYNVEEYFSQNPDDRNIKYEQFNFGVFDNLHSIFSSNELADLEQTNQIYREKIDNLSPIALKKEFERLLIELSWKSSQIEGNTYSLLDTEVLIKNNIQADGHRREEAVMILNHKKALEYIFENQTYFQDLTLRKIEELHEILTDDMDIPRGMRTSPVGIVGTNYKPLTNQHQIREAMEKLVELINKTKSIIEKALIAVIMISYIQPFEDGNKRTGRILANAIMYSYGYCPLSYRSVKDTDYKKAVIIFYENNSLEYFKRIFVEQFKFAVEKYF